MIKGIVRNTDPLGRVTLPKEMRSSTGIGTEGQQIFILIMVLYA